VASPRLLTGRGSRRGLCSARSTGKPEAAMTFRRYRWQSPSMLVTALVCLTLAGCTGTTSRRPAPSASTPATERPSNVRSPDTRVLRCQGSVASELGPDWQLDAVIAGPLTIPIARRHAAQLQPPQGRRALRGQGARHHRAGHDRHPRHRRRSAQPRELQPGSHPPTGGIWTIQDGVPSVTFEACTYKRTQFSGSILIDAPRCLPLRVPQSDGPAWRVVVSMGAGRCPGASSS